MNISCRTTLLLMAAALNVLADQNVVDGVHLRGDIPEVPARLLKTGSNSITSPVGDAEFIPASEFVPLGVYGGDWGEATWPFILEQIRKTGGNCYFVNGSHTPMPPGRLSAASAEGLVALCRQAARAGVRIYYQNQNSPLHWPSRVGQGRPREEVFQRTSAWARQVLPQFASQPDLRTGLLAWGITEEIDEGTARDPLLKKLKEQMEELDPDHPPLIVVMPNTIGVQKALLESWGHVPVLVADHYFNHRGIARSDRSRFNLQRLKAWSDLARHAGARLWLIPACFSMTDDLNPSVDEGYALLTPPEVEMGLWTGLAYGASGFMLFHQYDNDSTGRACLTRFDWKPTEEYVAATHFFRRIHRLAPLVAKWKIEGQVQATNGVAAGRFQHPDFPGEFVVVANTNPHQPVSYRPRNGCYELEGFTPIRGSLTIAGGDGRVLFAGARKELATFRKRMGIGIWPVEKKTFGASEAQSWTTEPLGKKRVANFPVAFGGKGARPVIARSNLPHWKGNLLEWGDGVKVPSRVYYPPYPGQGESTLHVQWNVGALAGAEADRAVVKLKLDQPIPGGRLAVYPVVADGLGYAAMTEYMPRWERRTMAVAAGEELSVHITGIVNEWISGRLQNNGVLIVYEGFPSDNRTVGLRYSPALEVEYTRRDQHR